jgi:hypothetical protein
MEGLAGAKAEVKVGGNQVNIPVIQTQVPSMTQVQQNINKVLNNIYGQVTTLQSSVSQIQGLGDVILSPLTLSQFQTIHGDDWIIANGQSSVGTSYETLTNNKTVPTVTVSGVTAFIKVN